jgi:ribonuclease J
MFKVHTIGGYNEVGKNMTAIEFQDDIFIFDSGFHISAMVDLQESIKQPTPKMLRDCGALPDDFLLEKQKDKVRAILISHAHLDHVGAVPFVAQRFPNAKICGTPFTIEVLRTIMKDYKVSLRNKIQTVNPDDYVMIKGKNTEYRVDFVNMTHSTIQSTMIALHSKEGIIAYCNDYKLDNTPVLGNPPNYKKMEELSKKGVKLMIVDSLYSGDEKKTPSEKIARALIEEVLLTVNHKDKAIFVTTFSSHIARLKSIVDFSKKLNRKPVFMGRSMAKYVKSAKNVGLCPFEKDIELVEYSREVNSKLKHIEKEREKYLVVCTGHQGEPGSIMDRLVKNELHFNFKPQDSVIFSSKIIPTPINESNRANIDKKLKKMDVRVFDHVHVSGHGGREDLRQLISILNPKNIIPSHGSLEQLSPAIELAKEMKYVYGRGCFLSQDRGMIEIR